MTAPAIRGYATTDDVAAFLGVTLTAPQVAQAAATIARAETWIDQATNRTFLSGPVIDETFFAPYHIDPPTVSTNYAAGWVPMGANLLLARTPVQSVEVVTGVPYLNVTPIVLIRDLEWEIRDLATGTVRLIVPTAYYQTRVSYTPVNACPADITQATIMLAATWLIPHLNPEAWQVDSFRLPDLEVRYAKGSNALGVPPEVQDVVDSYRFRSVG